MSFGSEILCNLVSYGLLQELRLRDPMRSRKLRLTPSYGSSKGYGPTRRLFGYQPNGCRDLIESDCLLELRLIQELRLRDLDDLVSYGLPQELQLKDPTRSSRLQVETIWLSAIELSRLNRKRLSPRLIVYDQVLPTSRRSFPT